MDGNVFIRTKKAAVLNEDPCLRLEMHNNMFIDNAMGVVDGGPSSAP